MAFTKGEQESRTHNKRLLLEEKIPRQTQGPTSCNTTTYVREKKCCKSPKTQELGEVSNLKQKSAGEKGAGREMAWKLQMFRLEKKVLAGT